MSKNASRFNAGKPKLSYCMEGREALEGEAAVWEKGAEKYSRGNWTRGALYTEAIDSMMRHIAKFLSGEDFDMNKHGVADASHTGLPHVDHIVCCAKILSQSYHTRPDLDDRDVKHVVSTVVDTPHIGVLNASAVLKNPSSTSK